MNLAFPHSWQAEALPQRPLILPSRHFTYPHEAEDVERGALEVLVKPVSDTPFLATFALGFADPGAPTGLWSCPHPDSLCAVAGGYAYIVNTREPKQFTHLGFRPILEIRPLPEWQLLIFRSHLALLAWGCDGQKWQSPRVSSEGVRIGEIRGGELHGIGWDLMSDREIPFAIDLNSGELVDGGIGSASQGPSSR